MAVPKYDDMYREILEILSDDQPHKIKDMRDALAGMFHVTEEERKELLPSGKQPLFNNRVNWACTYLKRASLIETISRGVYHITSQGKNIAASHPQHVDNVFLSQFESFRSFVSPAQQHVDKVTAPMHADMGSGQTPQDVLEEAYQRINDALIEDVLCEVMKQSPVFFEHLVVHLLTKMGYGGSLEDAGTVTRASGDEGIDGIICEDKLGFNRIYIQAKRWDRNSSVGRPELQKFVGALAGQGAAKGLLITTAQFTKEARNYARQQHTTKIVLVDGKALAKLMIEYDVGVSVQTTYFIKKIDSDFFDDNEQ